MATTTTHPTPATSITPQGMTPSEVTQQQTVVTPTKEVMCNPPKEVNYNPPKGGELHG